MGFWKDLKDSLDRGEDPEINISIPWEYIIAGLALVIMVTVWLVMR